MKDFSCKQIQTKFKLPRVPKTVHDPKLRLTSLSVIDDIISTNLPEREQELGREPIALILLVLM